jgi:hypothetical protein
VPRGVEEAPEERLPDRFDARHPGSGQGDVCGQVSSHALSQRDIQLDVKLKAVRAARAERLIDASIAAGQQLRARRQRERVVVPVKHWKRAPGRPEHVVALATGG